MSEVKRWTKKPVTIEALEWTGNNLREVTDFMQGDQTTNIKLAEGRWDDYAALVATRGLQIQTLEGTHTATVGDLIIKGVKGEFYPCKPDIFAMTYELESEAA